MNRKKRYEEGDLESLLKNTILERPNLAKQIPESLIGGNVMIVGEAVELIDGKEPDTVSITYKIRLIENEATGQPHEHKVRKSSKALKKNMQLDIPEQPPGAEKIINSEYFRFMIKFNDIDEIKKVPYTRNIYPPVALIRQYLGEPAFSEFKGNKRAITDGLMVMYHKTGDYFDMIILPKKNRDLLLNNPGSSKEFMEYFNIKEELPIKNNGGGAYSFKLPSFARGYDTQLRMFAGKDDFYMRVLKIDKKTVEEEQ